MRRFAAIVGFAVCAVVSLQPASMAAPPRARLAYSHLGRIWLLSADGSHRRAVTRGDTPAWSPDGALIAFVRESHNRGSVWVAAPKGTGARAVVSGAPGSYGAPAWSPDGSHLAVASFVATDDSLTTAIEVVNRDGTGRRTVISLRATEGLDSIGEPVWMPGGQRIAYTKTTAASDVFRHEIRSVKLDGTDDRLFMADALDGAWSPDGTRFAYSDVHDKHGTECGSDECFPNGELAVAAADGSNRRLLTHTVAVEAGPAWSADGSRIAFASGRNTPELRFSQYELYSIAPDGTCLTWLTNGTPGSFQPTWSPLGGDASPGRCGSGGRRPRVEVKPTRKQRGAPWVGKRLGSALLAGSQSDAHTVLFDYTDCGAFRARDCPPAFLLDVQHACSAGRELPFVVQALRGIRRVRGALVGSQRDDGRGVILTGRWWIHVQFESRATRAQESRLLHRIARALRPLGGHARSHQPRPVLPESARRRLPARVRGTTRRCP